MYSGAVPALYITWKLQVRLVAADTAYDCVAAGNKLCVTHWPALMCYAAAGKPIPQAGVEQRAKRTSVRRNKC